MISWTARMIEAERMRRQSAVSANSANSRADEPIGTIGEGADPVSQEETLRPIGTNGTIGRALRRHVPVPNVREVDAVVAAALGSQAPMCQWRRPATFT